MRSIGLFCALLHGAFALGADAPKKDEPKKEAPKKAPLKITPGQVIVPTDAMRRRWGELIEIDPKTRTGTFRDEATEEIMPFTIMPYAELLHHAAFGDIQDYRPGERAIFRLHENDEGKWVWLTYIQDEMNFLNNHKEYYWVDSIDAAKGRITFTQANGDKSYVREKDLVLQTDANTRYWKAAKPATFADIKVGDKLRTKTHGIGKGKERVCWEVFLDDESLQKFRDEQLAVHKKKMLADGVPGYVDALDGKSVKFTLFQEGKDVAKEWKAKQPVKVASAGVDKKANAAPVMGTIKEIKPAGNLFKVEVTLNGDVSTLTPKGVARLWKAE